MKHVLITGAGRGIGLEITLQCLKRGDIVFAGCRAPERAPELQSLAEAYPHQLTLLRIDVGDIASVRAASQSLRNQIRGLDVIFNNAAITFNNETILNVNGEDMLHAIRVNAVGAVMVVQAFLELLKAGQNPQVINISSDAGSISRMRSGRGYSYYGSKAALNMFTRALAFDRNMRGVIVVALHPGWVRTDMGGSMAPLTPSESVRSILHLLDTLDETDTGKFLNYDGREIPW